MATREPTSIIRDQPSPLGYGRVPAASLETNQPYLFPVLTASPIAADELVQLLGRDGWYVRNVEPIGEQDPLVATLVNALPPGMNRYPLLVEAAWLRDRVSPPALPPAGGMVFYGPFLELAPVIGPPAPPASQKRSTNWGGLFAGTLVVGLAVAGVMFLAYGPKR